MKSYLRYILIFIFSCNCFVQQSMAQMGRFYSTDTGLSSSLTNQLYQDSRGFVWTATEYGLSRFDGLHFTNYFHRSDDSTSIRNNYVRTLFEDDERNLLVGCIDGLMKYDRQLDSFSEIRMMRAGRQVFPHVTQMHKLGNGEIWVSTTGQGMFKLDGQRMSAFSLDDKLMQANYNYQSCFYEDSHGNIWIGTYGRGVICYKPVTGETKMFKYPAINDNNIYAIQEDGYGNLFIGTQKQGLFRYDWQKEQFTPVPCADDEAVSVYCLLSVDGRLLVGTDGQGVKQYNSDKGQLEQYNSNSTPRDFSTWKIHSIMVDKDKNLWLGAFQKGIVMIPKIENQFEYYGERSAYDNPIGHTCVMSVFQDSEQNLWVGADNEGLFKLSPDGKRLKHFKSDDSPHSVANTIMCIYEDSEKNFWLGSYTRGLAKMNRRTEECEYTLPIDNEKIFSITEDSHKNLYIATLGSGFYRYGLRTKTLEHFESSKNEIGNLKCNELANDWLNCLFCDSEGLIWIGHYKGISCFNPQTGSFLNYKEVNTLITDCIGYALLEDADGNIWAGTSEGLYLFDKKTEKVQRFTVNEGLPNNVICGLCTDNQHNVWLSTYMGISKCDIKSKRFVNYYAGDGLQGNEFMHGAFHKSESGKIYFGGINGITCFWPQNIIEFVRDLHVSIIEFHIFDRPVHKNTLSNGKRVIDDAVQDAETFRLSHGDNTFSLILSTLQYKNPEQISYQYKIEELGNRWLTTEPGRNRVTYNNLPPGKYTFSVCATSHDNLSEIRTVRILIAPPWYETWWAYCIYFSLATLLIWGIIGTFISRMQHRREIMKREHAEQLNEAKLQFFINISHEIRTPMTLIINPLEKLLSDRKEEELHKTYLMIYRNAQRILHLINQLMDIRKLDKGQMFLKFRETDIVGFIADVMQAFEYPALKKSILFSFRHDMPSLKVWIDLNNFDKVLMNILSNAFKYTPENGEIEIALTTGKDPARQDALREYFEIAVSDNGIGISQGEIERIFERFYQVDNDVTKSNFGTGIGLHLSRSLVELHHGVIYAENRKEASGTRFIIRLPLGAVHLRTDELETAKGEKNITLHSHILQPEEMLPVEAKNAGAGKHKSHLNILIVEDEEEIRSYLEQEMKNEYHVATCNNGKEAYNLILKEMPDLVISDVMMPEMDGLTLCRKMKQNTNINHIPIVLLTAKSRMEDTLEGMDMGADAYIVKPFNTEFLKSTIANLLVNRRLLRNKFSGRQLQKDKVENIAIKSSDEMLMSRIMKVVNEHISDPEFSVERLASEVGLSRVHVHRKLKELTNSSARDFIKNIRLQQAASLLAQDKKLAVSEVAYAIGYTNLSYFSYSFKEKYGISPKEYAASYDNNNEKQ